MKKKIFVIILSFLLFIFLYLIFGLWGLVEINRYNDFIFKNKEDLNFHKNYSNKMHHLRDVNKWDGKNEYLYSKIYFNKKSAKTILLQGDSWIEDISKNKISNNFLKIFGKKNNYNIFNAGITSFAPSTIHSQYKILKSEFSIKPDILIIYIDQTDIGDEYCRYQHNKIYTKNGKFSHVNREKFTRATYDYSKLYLFSELSLNNNLLKILKFPYLKSNYFFKRNLNLLNQILVKGFKNRNESKCGFQEIMKELISYNKDAEKVFKKSLEELIEFLSNESLESVILVSFPHINHHKNIYKVNVSDYIDEVLQRVNLKFIKHLNMNKLNFSNIDIEKIYRKGDLGSHLNDEFHQKLFIKNIVSNL